MVCASTSGRAPNTTASSLGSASKSGISSSTPQPGTASWIARQGWPYSQAPPSGRACPGQPGTVGFERLGPAGGYLAEVTAPGALIAADQERRLAVFPALEDVRAAGFLADGVQALAPHELLHRGVLGPGAHPGLDPRGLALDRRLAVACLEPQHPASFGCEYHVSSVWQSVEAWDTCRGGFTPRRAPRT